MIHKVSLEISERFGLLLASDRTQAPEKLKRAAVDALHFRHPGSTKLLPESGIFC